MTCLVLRPTNIYGPGDKFDFECSHFLAAMIRRVVERQDPLVVWGTGEDVRDWIYVDDVVDAMLLATEHIDSFEPLNIGFGQSRTIKEMVALILKIAGHKAARVTFDPTKPFDHSLPRGRLHQGRTNSWFQGQDRSAGRDPTHLGLVPKAIVVG